MYLENDQLVETPPVQAVIGFPVTALSLDDYVSLIVQWAKHRLSKIACVANIHMLIEAKSNPALASILHNADLVTPNGMPLVWTMRLTGVPNQERVAGMDLLLGLCKQASQQVSLFFLGSETEILERMRARLEQEFPELQIAGMEPLPFRPLSPEEDETIIRKINSSGAGITLVSLGCPKQELWIAEHKNKIQSVLIGIGGVFPVYAGIHKRAPEAIRNLGMEWFYRLVQEPRRLWRRYGSTIPPFLWLASKQLAASQVRRSLSFED